LLSSPKALAVAEGLPAMIVRVLGAAVSALALIGCATTPGAATTAQPDRCTAPEFRQLDFWVGTWDVRWGASEGQAAGNGVNTVTRELGNCVIQEHFVGGPTTGDLMGLSVSTYHAGPGLWRQTWVDNQGGYFALTGGVSGEAFILENTRIVANAPFQRMTFEDITPNSLTWRWQRSTDAGATWTDAWVIYYQRRE
jgi:hypothetical protein